MPDSQRRSAFARGSFAALGSMSSIVSSFADALVGAGVASRLNPDTLSGLEAFLSRQMPWLGTHLAWGEIEGSVCLECGSFDDGAIIGFVSRLAAVQNETVCVVFSGQLGLRFSSRWFLRNLNVAACGSQQFFAFSSTRISEAAQSLAEFEPGSTIWGMLPNKPLHATALRNTARER
jgi:hypothetical protein